MDECSTTDWAIRPQVDDYGQTFTGARDLALEAARYEGQKQPSECHDAEVAAT